MSIKSFIEQKILEVLKQLNIDAKDALVSQSNRPDLSDYQSNVAMSLAKVMHKNPREVATLISEELKKQDWVQSISVDGPGFINIRLTDAFLLQDFDIPTQSTGRTIVIDYGGPNIAKEMHVGHLRSAVIGESLKKIMRAMGDKVIGDVHFGDWGTPIGMLIAQLKKEQPDLAYFKDDFTSSDFDISISEISALYRRAAATFKEDEQFKEDARVATFDLQAGHKGYRALWKLFRDKSVQAVKVNYDSLGVDFDLWMGESDVNDLLPKLIEDLKKKKLLVESEGAQVVFIPPKNNHERPPVIFKKSDGAYTYAATDMATIIQRVRDFKPQAILYVVDARQREHFEQVFEVAHMAGYVDDSVSLEHIPFGTVNGKDGKPFKTRSGGVMNLKDLIDLAIDKARENIPSNADQTEADKQAKQVAIGALIYQDLKNTRISDYIFDTENFTKSEGKTGAYLQYAVARINSILDKSGVSQEEIEQSKIQISHPLERDLLLHLRRCSEAMENSYCHREPSIISEYDYLLAQKFSSFYAELSVNNEKDVILRVSRLKLVLKTREHLKICLGLLGIQTPERMLKIK